ncbi:UNVERIFIED_CONTAM: hypothetical protein FKN15_052212 [Acipenser sinensis]
MMEIALTLIDTWCKENKYVIAGYYQANERIKETRPNQFAEKVAARIAENFSDAALIMVDNSNISMGCYDPAISVFEHHDNKWKCRDTNIDCCEDWSEAQKITSALLEDRSYDSLIDFDNHLDDLRNDWTNKWGFFFFLLSPIIEYRMKLNTDRANVNLPGNFANHVM